MFPSKYSRSCWSSLRQLRHWSCSTKSKHFYGLLTIFVLFCVFVYLELIHSNKDPSKAEKDPPLPGFINLKHIAKLGSKPSLKIHSVVLPLQSNANLLGCRIPKLSPDQRIVLGFDKDTNLYPPACLAPSVAPKFIIDFNSRLVQVEPNSTFWNSTACFYVPEVRIPDKPDFTFREAYDIIDTVTSPITQLGSDIEHLYVWCNAPNNTKIYEDYLSTVQLKPELEANLTSNIIKAEEQEEYYNVMIIGQDSSSHMNFRRYMPKVHKYLMEKLDAVEFNGFNSLGPGTLWSFFALLTGLDLNEIRKSCWSSDESSFLDDCPWIWHEFERAGYRTAYDEDNLRTRGNFNEGKPGFRTQPFHYDFRTASLKLDERHKGHELDNRCYGSRLSFSVLLENMARMAVTFRDKPHWTLLWSQALSHSVNSDSKHGEGPLLSHLQFLKRNNLLDRTFLIMFSDHGMRYGAFRRETRQGFLEERLPILYIVVPPKFQEKYPLAMRNLRANSERLTTAMDVHETMKDLLNLTQVTDPNLKSRAEQPNFGASRKTSLFLPVSPSRTCDMIGFSFVYCACIERKTLPRDDVNVVKATKFIEIEISKILAGHPECSSLKIVKTYGAFELEAQVSEKDERDRFGSSSSNETKTEWAPRRQFEISVQTKPGRGIFYVGLQEFKGEFKLEQLTRTSKYGDDGNCIGVKELKPLCYCKRK